MRLLPQISNVSVIRTDSPQATTTRPAGLTKIMKYFFIGGNFNMEREIFQYEIC